MIDISNLDKLSPEKRVQFNALLEQFPHLDSKMETARELNTPTKDEMKFVVPPSQRGEEMDYTNFLPDSNVGKDIETSKRDNLPSIKVDPKISRLSFEAEEEKPRLKEEDESVRNEKIQKQRIKKAVEAGQFPEIAGFNPEGKTHPILQKLRATVGLRSNQKPTTVNVGGCTYSIRAVDRMNMANATALAVSVTTNPILYQTNIESAIVSYSVAAIDGVPLTEIFSIPTHDAKDGSSLTFLQREEMAAAAFFTELMQSPNELTEALSTYYQQNFPILSLLGEGKSKFICPVGECLQSRIENWDATCYCPVHGEKMAREELLPNPS
jgi:hypothetical protein